MINLTDSTIEIRAKRMRQLDNWFAQEGVCHPNQAAELKSSLYKYFRKLQHAKRALNRANIAGFQSACHDLFCTPVYLRLGSIFEIERRRSKRKRVWFEGINTNDLFGYENTDLLRRMCQAETACRPVTPIFQFRSNQETRTTYEFHMADCVKQSIASDICLFCLGFNEFDYNQPKARGIHAAAEYLRANVFNGRFPYWVSIDIRNAFPSVKRRHVRTFLPLPQSVLSDVVCPNPTYNHERRRNLHVTRCMQADSGLPQGSISSSAILGALIAREVSELSSSDGTGVVFVDDMAFGASTQARAQEVLSELRSRFRSLDGGPLAFSREEVCHPLDGEYLEFAGYRFYRDTGTGEDICEPSSKAMNRMLARTEKKLKNDQWGDPELGAEVYFENWWRSFSAKSNRCPIRGEAWFMLQNLIDCHLSV